MAWHQKLLSLFLSGESAFAGLQVQALTLDNHPDNITTFEAVSLYDACLKADEALRVHGVQGAVWIRNEQEPFLPDPMALIKRLREKTGSLVVDGTMMRSRTGFITQTDMVKGEDGSYSARFDTYNPLAAEEVVDPQRLGELTQLTRLFDVSTLSTRYQMEETVDPHYDYYVPGDPEPIQEEKLFLGRPMRILVSRHQPSSILYNTQGEPPYGIRSGNIRRHHRDVLKEAWQPAVGDYIFQCNWTWGIEKALPHSPPEFSCEAEDDCRVLDIYDVKDGRNLSEIEAAGPNDAEPG